MTDTGRPTGSGAAGRTISWSRRRPTCQPGDALDVGCGEGADAIWLAARGWRVTGVDVSVVALERAARHATAQGAADR